MTIMVIVALRASMTDLSLMYTNPRIIKSPSSSKSCVFTYSSTLLHVRSVITNLQHMTNLCHINPVAHFQRLGFRQAISFDRQPGLLHEDIVFFGLACEWQGREPEHRDGPKPPHGLDAYLYNTPSNARLSLTAPQSCVA